MAWSDPKTWTADDLLTASDLNQYVSDNLSALYALVQGGGRKNLLHNGAMQVSQRGTSTASITTSGYYTADRWYFYPSLGTWTESVENDAPTGSGFRKSLKMLVTTADASPSASDYAQIYQKIEGQNLQSVKKGTASAQPLTLSFWTKSNKTGTYIVELYDADNTRTVSATYTVASSGTWEQQTITFPADASGALDNDANASLTVSFWLAAGTDFTSGALATTWGANAAANRVVGQTNLAASNSNYWQITGVQLEVGSAATGFEWKDYGQELAECQRYYYRLGGAANFPLGLGVYMSSTEIDILLKHPVRMRSGPTPSFSSGTSHFFAQSAGAGIDYFDTFTAGFVNGTDCNGIYVSSGVSSTAGQACNVVIFDAAGYVAFSADL